MTQVELRKVNEMYEYLRAPARELPEYSDVTFAFGRKSSELIIATAEAGEVSDYLVVSGNVGKDSGDLPQTGTPESLYVVKGVTDLGAIACDRVRTETRALDGIEAAIYGLEIIEKDLRLPSLNTMVAVMHPTQTRRLGGTLTMQAERAGLKIDRFIHYPTKYQFDSSNRFDQNEAAVELAMIDTYSKGLTPILRRPDDLPMDLVEYAHALKKHFKDQFRQEGIRNPSTAENTDRSKSPIQTILFNAGPGAGLPRRLEAYGKNFTYLGRAAARQKILPKLPR